MYELSRREKELCTGIVDCAFQVHKKLGPGLLERIYESCFCYELDKHSIPYRRQVDVPLLYDGQILKDRLRLDVLVDDQVVVEIKAVEAVLPVWYAQVRSYLQLINRHVGFLLNFNVPVIKEGIRRLCMDY